MTVGAAEMIWGLHKPRGQLRGRRGIAKLTLTYISLIFFSKSAHEGGGGQNTQTFVHVVYGWPLFILCTYFLVHIH